MEYPRHEKYKGIDFYYYLVPNIEPSRLKIEPIYQYEDEYGNRYSYSRLERPHRKVMVGINVYGVYEG